MQENEITAEMLEAGVDCLTGYDPDFVSGYDLVAQIYRTMEAAKHCVSSKTLEAAQLLVIFRPQCT